MSNNRRKKEENLETLDYIMSGFIPSSFTCSIDDTNKISLLTKRERFYVNRLKERNLSKVLCIE